MIKAHRYTRPHPTSVVDYVTSMGTFTICTSIRFALAVSSLVLLISTSALATPLTWTLTGVTFNDAITASGFFDYDAGSNVYSNFHVSTSSGNVYIALPPFIGSNQNVLDLLTQAGGDLTNVAILQMFFVPPLTDAGGIIPLNIARGGEGLCSTPNCGAAFFTRRFTAGTVVAASTPEPSAFILCAIGLLGLAGYQWQQRRREGLQIG